VPQHEEGIRGRGLADLEDVPEPTTSMNVTSERSIVRLVHPEHWRPSSSTAGVTARSISPDSVRTERARSRSKRYGEGVGEGID
jgi:hypothetical protein